MTPDSNADAQQKTGPGERANLDQQYGNIGISAVAAALHYQGDAKNPAYAPAEARDHEPVVTAG
jgi:hypothetical protein